MEQKTPQPGTAPANAKGPGAGGRGGQMMQQQQRRRAPKSRYGVQMSEKQDFKKLFGIREEQLRKYYAEAQRSKQQTGKVLVVLLERRLDNAIYRAGFAPTRAAARQMATHRIFTVNGKPVDVPSYRLKAKDIVAVKESKRTKPLFTNFVKSLQNVHPPAWLLLDPENFSFTVQTLPTAEEANLGVDVQAIIEFFAR
jgi:small subunit ribosomal protein S4